MKKKEKLYAKDWLILKPYDGQSPSDFYYLKICNKVKDILVAGGFPEENFSSEIEDKTNLLSCFLTSYFEDIISDTNIWNSFVRLHKKLYGKYLPFYDTDNYFEEEVNFEDVAFLIWYFLSLVEEDMIIYPYTKNLFEVAGEITDLFDDEWDDAPLNRNLQNAYLLDEDEKDYYLVRNFIQTILFRTYLFLPDTGFQLDRIILDIHKGHSKDKNLTMFIDDAVDNSTHNARTRLLSLSGKEWAAEILGPNHPLKEDLLDMSKKVNGFFLYKGENSYYIFLEHIASGERFSLTKESIEKNHKMDKDDIIYIGMVRWRGEWWFSGTLFVQPYDPKIVEDEKKSSIGSEYLYFLPQRKSKTEEILVLQKKIFLEFNNGSPIAFLKMNEISDFLDKFFAYYNEKVGLRNEQVKGESKKPDLPRPKISLDDLDNKKLTGVVFFNPNSGIEIGVEIASAFDLPNNPYFNIKKSEENILYVLTSDDVSTELAKFCIEQGKDKLPFFKDDPLGQLIVEEADFLIRFWKGSKYHTTPKVNLV